MPPVEYLAVFSSAFLAATLLPAASEVVLAGTAAAEDADPWLLLGLASAGNTLGSVVNWMLGRYLWHWREHRWFPIGAAGLERASGWFNRFGIWSLLFAWVPVIGDPLTLMAGVFQVRFPIFVTLVAIGKTVRYAVVLGLVQLVL